ncbi:MAG TPA: efflux RND transporter periplasmic adaptor subunit [Gemmatimonas sp.]|nr:efflux RND transporter periplasmic adaptor subunit [Gemmatimonas sp.]
MFPHFSALVTPFSRCSTMLLIALVVSGCDTMSAATGDSAAIVAADSAIAAQDAGTPALALPVAAQEAREGDLVLRVNTTGQVRSDATVRLTSEVAGTVHVVLVRPGARVMRGQALLRLDPGPFDLTLREAQAAVDESEQRYLESYVPDSIVNGVGPTDTQRKSLVMRAGLAAARVRLERAQRDRLKATVVSPVDGSVDAINIGPGEFIGGGQHLMTVVDMRNLRIEAQVLEHDLPLIRAGGEVNVTSVGAPGRIIRGRIDAVLPLVDSVTRAGRAVIRVLGDGMLRPGMYADVQLEAARLVGRRIVPSRAVIERDGRPLVFVVRDGRAQWTYINIGRNNGTDTEVLPDSSTNEIPVRAGDQVIVEGHLTLTHDAPVRVSAPRERESAESVAVRSRRPGSRHPGSR